MKRLLPLLSLVLLNACLLVDDFGSAWKEAQPDPCLDKIMESLYAGEYSRDYGKTDFAELGRGWTYKNEHFILLKQSASDAGGRLYRFRVVNGIFERYRLNPTMRETFAKEYPDAPVHMRRDTIRVETLDDATKKLLIEIVQKPEYWEVEDKTLYNTIRNPTCRFEDRDLKKLEADEKKKVK